MPGLNGALNSSFELGDLWLRGLDLPSNWIKQESASGATFINPVFDQVHFPYGVVSLYMQDNVIIPNGGYMDLYQESGMVPGTGGPIAFAIDFQGFTNHLSAFVQIICFNSSHSAIATYTNTWTNAQLSTLGAFNNPVRLSVTGTAPAGTTGVGYCFGYLNASGSATPSTAQAQGLWDNAQYETSSVPSPYSPADGYQGGGGGGGVKDPVLVYLPGEYVLESPAGSLKFNDHNYNEGFDLIVNKAEGLYPLPDIKASGDYEDPTYHGGFAGPSELISSRTITLTLTLRADSQTQYNKKLQSMKTMLFPDGTDKKLWYRRLGIGGYTKKFVNVRTRRFGGFDSDYDSSRGFGTGAIQFNSFDPALYDFLSVKGTANPTAGSTGSFPFTGLNFASIPGIFRTYPVINITGPVTNPHITRSYGGTITSEENYAGELILATTIPTGQTVKLDARDGSVVNVSTGADWRQYLDDANEWFGMSPWPSSLLYVAAHANPNPTAWSATIEYWPAWL